MKKDKKNIKKIEYEISCDEYRKVPLELFDLLGFKQNIVIHLFRAANLIHEGVLKSFEQKIQCKIIKDVTREDSYCVFIPKVNSNIELYELIGKIYNDAECAYFPLINDLETFLFNWGNITRKDAVAQGVCLFEAIFDMDYGTNLYFDPEYFEQQKIENTLEKWKKTFGDVKFIKRSNNR